MSAENAWRIAMEFAVVAGNPRPTADFEAAFRAEVEAETGERVLNRAFCDVLTERQRQIKMEGWTLEHDDAHDRGELSAAAACYAHFGWVRPSTGAAPTEWPWDAEWWKPKDRRTDLVRAAALLIAEIERLDRARLKAKGESQ